MDIRRFDIAFDFFVDIMGEEAARALEDGQDVTEVFADDIARPVKAVIIEAEAWLIEQPCPEILMSRTVPSSATSRKSTTSSPQSGLKPSTRWAGGTGSSPRLRGDR